MTLLYDLDDLLLAVRSKDARAHFSDAVACYRAGALRPAVVATWSAVVFDVVGKVRELELTGDPQAKSFMTKFEAARQNTDVKAAQEIERGILDEARDAFELLTPQEHADSERLRQDRHRCAHPAMNTAEEPYQPSAELVRYHLRNAVTHLLAHPPVQGKAALARVHADVESSLFPTTRDGAHRVLRAGPLQHPRQALLREFLRSTLRAILVDAARGDDEAFVTRAIAALEAAAVMHPARVAEVYAAELPRVLDAVKDEHLGRIVVRGARLSVVWEHMPDAVRAKLERLVETSDKTAAGGLMPAALATPALRDVAEAQVRAFTTLALGTLVEAAPATASASRAVVERGMDLLARASSFDAANAVIRRVLLPLAPVLMARDLERLVETAAANGQVENAFETLALLEAVRDLGVVDRTRFESIIAGAALDASLQRLLLADDEPATDGDEDDEPPRGPVLVPGGRVRHRKFGLGTVERVIGGGRDGRVVIVFDDDAVGRKTLVTVLANLAADDR